MNRVWFLAEAGIFVLTTISRLALSPLSFLCNGSSPRDRPISVWGWPPTCTGIDRNTWSEISLDTLRLHSVVHNQAITYLPQVWPSRYKTSYFSDRQYQQQRRSIDSGIPCSIKQHGTATHICRLYADSFPGENNLKHPFHNYSAAFHGAC